ncbi:RNA chaperone ProQ [Aliiglaciecola sp. CAU 1673]|uniref:RNA chaperone ProQ n=1 Tax=Aliiglaciecola sp. CAU 1673 TaxID=3032595 RepID=UPI0023D97F6B|nr:RNA chaperone ProQ [Aliiglaciecola sp. CAU 1673]MDF2177537.1 RNA chaperone ProQ [Aliiglaciecola sp. CAU 1673]
MDSPQKFSNSKEVIAFLAETFPACFSLEGQAKPLKIGIFQDLAERLNQDERISKTLLRASLRHYTSSWRYLHAIVEGASRVDLDGNAGDVIEKQHAEHAQQQLAESKQKVVQKKKEQAAKNAPAKPRYKKSAKTETKSAADGTKVEQAKPSRKSPPQKLTDSDLVSGTEVTVKIGKLPVPGTISEVGKEGVHVQLNSGMVVKVPAESLRLARPKR